MKEGSHKGVYLLKLTIENVRCFKEKTTIDLRDPNTGGPARWTVILGENGTGKTTVLRSLVTAFVMANNHETHSKDTWLASMRFRKDSFDYVDRKTAFIGWQYCQGQLDSESGKIHLLNFNLTDGPSNSYDIYEFFIAPVFAYGASRKMSHAGIEKEALEDASLTLFDEEATLTNPADILLTIDYKSLKEASWIPLKTKFRDIILRILPDVDDWDFVPSENGLSTNIKFHTQDGWVRLRDLSLGYKTTISWVVDFAMKLVFFYHDSLAPLSEPAICLVDEIDLHMHPSWQRTIMKELSAIFTNTQFIVTAHSPLIVQAAADANIVVLKRNAEGVVKENNDPTDVRHWRVDQILASDLFGKQPVFDVETQAQIDLYFALKQKGTLSDKEQKELEQVVPVVREALGPGFEKSELELKIDAFLREHLI